MTEATRTITAPMYDYLRQCDGKTPYLSFGAARAIVHKRMKENPSGAPLTIYICPHCRAFHIGTVKVP